MRAITYDSKSKIITTKATYTTVRLSRLYRPLPPMTPTSTVVRIVRIMSRDGSSYRPFSDEAGIFFYKKASANYK